MAVRGVAPAPLPWRLLLTDMVSSKVTDGPGLKG